MGPKGKPLTEKRRGKEESGLWPVSLTPMKAWLFYTRLVGNTGGKGHMGKGGIDSGKEGPGEASCGSGKVLNLDAVCHKE